MDKKEKAKEKREKRRQEISLLRTIPYSDHQRWWTSDTIAVVTGANRGIGFEIAHQLGMHGLTVVVTSRETGVGEEAVKVMQEGGLNVAFHQLDIVDPSSLKSFSEWLKETYGGLDILINNAGVNFNVGTSNSVENAETVIKTNYYGTKNMTKTMIPLMRSTAAGGHIKLQNDELRKKLEDVDKLSEELIDQTVESFLKQVKEGTWESGGWPQTFTDYSVSKLAVNAFTRLMARELSDRPDGQKIYINCYCPGWVKTALTGWAGSISPEEAADTPVWLSLIPDKFVTGKFFAERREINF
nr:carbonyl reductase [NADPH] 1-like [Ipomoea trifida]